MQCARKWRPDLIQQLSKISFLLVFAVLVQVMPLAQNGAGTEDSRGTLADGSVYRNAILGLTIKLPGTWQLRDKGVAHGASEAGCTGPLCKDPEVDVKLAPKNGRSDGHGVYLAAWKLAPEYRNRNQYPLKWFARVMTTGSLGQSNWVPLGGLASIQLDGRPAYRLLVGEPGGKEAMGFGFVSEASGYVFLLVGSTASSVEESALQAAVENLEFSKPPR